MLHLESYIESFYTDIILKQNKTTMLSQFIVKTLKCFLVTKNFFVSPSSSRFPVKLYCYIAFRSPLSAFSLLKSIAISLQCFLE